MSSAERPTHLELIANLGAEEGPSRELATPTPAVRAAARLWALLFDERARLHAIGPPAAATAGKARGEPGRAESDSAARRDSFWPPGLGPPDPGPALALPALSDATAAHAWLNTPAARARAEGLGQRALAGPPPECVALVHDKAFAFRAARQTGGLPRSLAGLIEVLEPEALRQPEVLLPRLDARLADWPAWTGFRFCLKPRFGTSGRGRVAGRTRVTSEPVRGALARLAERGGALFEPWLERLGDFSVSIELPPLDAADPRPTISGSLEMWTTASGLYRGHLGEVDARGRVFSGDHDDETLRAEAVAIANHAREAGYWGSCGIDAFRYREPDPDQPKERLRTGVELNARHTMGLVTIGLVRRALPAVRAELQLTPGDRRGFALVFRDARSAQAQPFARYAERIRNALGDRTRVLDLSSAGFPEEPQPVLVFAEGSERIRKLGRRALER